MLNNANGKIARYIQIKEKISELKSEAESIEAELLKEMTVDLEDTKYKSVYYADDSGNTVTATRSDNLKLVYPSFLRNIFGKAYADVVTEETTYKLSAAAKRLLIALHKQDYVRGGSLEELIGSLQLDDKSAKALHKKLKGKNFDTDVKNLIKIAGLDEDKAKKNAYLAAEIAAWTEFMRLMELNGTTSDADIAKALTWIDGAVTVEETPKITITSV
ncbi:hypothetical protein [Ruminococcus sp. Marseille-P6503]|uniref:hypothetical protein n=1 Tax=Ruminococcus sp. Marseille-P6503 TaxID=2364796 RepID=UPI000F541589|nr:hypothetical protein [Ruminococcus sp. Marseille-P6503]